MLEGRERERMKREALCELEKARSEAEGPARCITIKCTDVEHSPTE